MTCFAVSQAQLFRPAETKKSKKEIKANTAAATKEKAKLAKSTLEESLSQMEAKSPVDLSQYEMVWNDEFSGSDLDTLKWQYQTARAGWVNHELQTYVDGRSPKGQPVTKVSDGSLKIYTFREEDIVYSARIYGHRNTGFQYGYFEARMRLPKGKGTWPAFWMMPVQDGRWPACGEIDIMEEVGVEAGDVVATIHCEAYNHTKGTQKTKVLKEPTSEEDFHVYSLLWTADCIRMYVDGKPSLVFPNDGKGDVATWPFNKPFYPIFNVAWGGDWGGHAGVDESALPLTMEVDYIRVYQQKASHPTSPDGEKNI